MTNRRENIVEHKCTICGKEISDWFFQNIKKSEKYCIECYPNKSHFPPEILEYFANLTKLLELTHSKLDRMEKMDYDYNHALLIELENIKRLQSKSNKQVVALFDPIVIDLLFKHTGMTLEELVQQIKNKEINRMLNDIKKERKTK